MVSCDALEYIPFMRGFLDRLLACRVVGVCDKPRVAKLSREVASALLTHVQAHSGMVHSVYPDFDVRAGILPSFRHVIQRLQLSGRPRQLAQPNIARWRARGTAALDFFATRLGALHPFHGF